MAAGLGFKDFVTGEVLTAADVDGYLMQGVWVFASAAARTSAVTSPQEGNFSFLKDTNSTEYYDGSTWIPVSGGSTYVGAKAYNNATQAIANNTVTTLTWNSEYFDTSAIHSTATNTSRFTVPSGKAGKWALNVQLTYSGAPSATQIRVDKNGTLLTNLVSQGEVTLQYYDIYELIVGDYFEVAAYQTSGGSINVKANADSFVGFSFLGA